MLFSLLEGSDFSSALISLLLSLPVIMLALSIHETAHGFAAWKCGDDTAYNLGRLSLNPFKHLDLLGVLSMLLIGYGWAKPVPINTRNLRNPKWGMALCAAAGPLANLLLGAFSALCYGVFSALFNYLSILQIPAFLLTCADVLVNLCLISAYLNFVFAVFNLIPVPPFDGSRLALVFLPTRLYFGIMRYERQIMLGVLGALLILNYFDLSPFGWIASKLTLLIAEPVFKAIIPLLFPRI